MGSWPLVAEGGVYETEDANTSASRGTAFTAGNGVKGSYAQVVASTGVDAEALWLTMAASSANEQIVDLAVGAAASEQIIIANLLNGGQLSNEVRMYYFPIHIPAGTRLSARSEVSSGSGVSTYIEALLVGPSFAGSAPFNRVTSYGIDTSRATAFGTVVDAGSSANTKSSWVQVDAACANPLKWLTIVVNAFQQTRTATQRWLFDVGIGAGGSEQVLLSNLWFAVITTSGPMYPTSWSFPVSIPAGTRLALRAQCNSTTSNERRAAFAFYGSD